MTLAGTLQANNAASMFGVAKSDNPAKREKDVEEKSQKSIYSISWMNQKSLILVKLQGESSQTRTSVTLCQKLDQDA